MYYLRTDTGTLVAKFDNHVAGEIIRKAKGHWTEKVMVGGRKKTCFVFGESCTFGNNFQSVYMWANFYLSDEA